MTIQQNRKVTAMPNCTFTSKNNEGVKSRKNQSKSVNAGNQEIYPTLNMRLTESMLPRRLPKFKMTVQMHTSPFGVSGPDNNAQKRSGRKTTSAQKHVNLTSEKTKHSTHDKTILPN